MSTFREYYNQQEGVGQFVKGVFNQQYAALPQQYKDYYDMLNKDQKAAIEEIRTSRQIPLGHAVKMYMDETGARDQLRQYKKYAGPERQPVGQVMPWGNDSPGWKRYGA